MDKTERNPNRKAENTPCIVDMCQSEIYKRIWVIIHSIDGEHYFLLFPKVTQTRMLNRANSLRGGSVEYPSFTTCY